MEKKARADSFHVEHRSRVLPIKKIVEETSTIKSFYIKYPEIALNSEPGQFVMLWVLDVDEIPMSISKVENDGTLAITVEKVGDATARLHEIGEGDLIGVRGPYGRGFDLSCERPLMVAGGCGMAPLAFALERSISMGKDVGVILGAKTAYELLFRSRIEKMGTKPIISTEDGTAGVKGLAVDAAKEVLSENEFDSCLICGPELMMVKVAELALKRDIPVQVSLDRYIKCGIGLCGQCCLDPLGVRICCEGPVFSYEDIRNSEFGSYRRDAAGLKRRL